MRIIEKTNREILSQLTEIANNLDLTKDIYLQSYPHFLNYFKNIQEITLENAFIGISFTYSWMPTILKSIKLSDPEKLLTILNVAKNGKQLDEEQLWVLKSAFNNSLVGTTKLLHFINPMQYAIWDSRVFRFLNDGEAPHKYKLEKPAVYLEYLRFLKDLTLEVEFKNFYQLMRQRVGYEITEFRALEFVFFKGIESIKLDEISPDHHL